MCERALAISAPTLNTNPITIRYRFCSECTFTIDAITGCGYRYIYKDLYDAILFALLLPVADNLVSITQTLVGSIFRVQFQRIRTTY